jgi:hypothetical protein
MARSTLRLPEHVLLQNPLCPSQELSSCPSSPVASDKMHIEMPKSSSLEVLPSQKISGPFRRALYPAPAATAVDDIQKRLEKAASCIQEALALHRRNVTETGTEKKCLSSSNVYKVPNVPGAKKTATTASQGDARSSVNGRLMKPKPLTPYPGKKTKPVFPDKATTPLRPSTSATGRINAGINRRRPPNPSDL